MAKTYVARVNKLLRIRLPLMEQVGDYAYRQNLSENEAVHRLLAAGLAAQESEPAVTDITPARGPNPVRQERTSEPTN